jgi:prevent-host-death family protein
VTVVTVHHAKTHPSKLLDRALRGQEVVNARAGKPLVKLTPVADDHAPAMPPPRVPGPLAHKFREGMGGAFLEPMSEEELAEGYDGPVYPEQR